MKRRTTLKNFHIFRMHCASNAIKSPLHKTPSHEPSGASYTHSAPVVSESGPLLGPSEVPPTTYNTYAYTYLASSIQFEVVCEVTCRVPRDRLLEWPPSSDVPYNCCFSRTMIPWRADRHDAGEDLTLYT